LGHPEWCEDLRFATNQQHGGPRRLRASDDRRADNKTTEHWVEVLEAACVPCGPVYNYAQMFADPQSELDRAASGV
jgi:crotonobetainyl-CoA:carnitine CoA-transferase CaiB-like acyl-CoA transferase